MVVLSKKERSAELNDLDRILIDFKSFFSDEGVFKNGIFKMFKKNNDVYYIFDTFGFFQVRKTGNFTFLEDFIKTGEHITISSSELKKITSLKKSEVINISYDENEYKFEIEVEGVKSEYTIQKDIEDENSADWTIEFLVDSSSDEILERDFIKANYNIGTQMLEIANGSKYPYKISFSDNINFKLKIDEGISKYFLKLILDGSFIQVVTISDYKDFYKVKSIIHVFNYLNNRGV